jgi:hypothetical protein
MSILSISLMNMLWAGLKYVALDTLMTEQPSVSSMDTRTPKQVEISADGGLLVVCERCSSSQRLRESQVSLPQANTLAVFMLGSVRPVVVLKSLSVLQGTRPWLFLCPCLQGTFP